MFEWWQDLLRPVRRSDPDFGRMRFLRQTRTWECVAGLAPVRGRVEVLVDADAGGPSEEQRQRWRELPARYEELARQARPMIASLAAEHGIEDFVHELACVSLPAASRSDADLELTFGNVSGPPQFDVAVRSWKILGVDGPL